MIRQILNHIFDTDVFSIRNYEKFKEKLREEVFNDKFPGWEVGEWESITFPGSRQIRFLMQEAQILVWNRNGETRAEVAVDIMDQAFSAWESQSEMDMSIRDCDIEETLDFAEAFANPEVYSFLESFLHEYRYLKGGD